MNASSESSSNPSASKKRPAEESSGHNITPSSWSQSNQQVNEDKKEKDDVTSSSPGETNNNQTQQPVVLSKNQLKKKRRYERAMEIKKRKKQQDKERKRVKALADGRDLEKEKRLQEERTKSGEGHKRREEEWLKRMKTADTSFRVCIDCSFEDQMTPKEINSLALQIRYCYATNKRSNNPCYLSVSSLGAGTTTRNHLEKVAGFPDQWLTRAFDCSDKSFIDMHPDKQNLVYLTSDSEHILDHLDDDKVYVIGGIVDRNRLSRAAISRAERFGVATAKLPISQYLQLVNTTKVLTCNHVFEILLKYRQYGNDWKQAMIDVLPQRKDVQPLDDRDDQKVKSEKK